MRRLEAGSLRLEIPPQELGRVVFEMIRGLDARLDEIPAFKTGLRFPHGRDVGYDISTFGRGLIEYHIVREDKLWIELSTPQGRILVPRLKPILKRRIRIHDGIDFNPTDIVLKAKYRRPSRDPDRDDVAEFLKGTISLKGGPKNSRAAIEEVSNLLSAI